MDVSTTLPQEFFEVQVGKCGEISLGEGSLEQCHVDSLSLLDFKGNANCVLAIPMHLKDECLDKTGMA